MRKRRAGFKMSRALLGCWIAGIALITLTPFLPASAFASSWTIVSSPNTTSTQDNYLNSVSCISATDCVAVGYHVSANGYQTLIEENIGSGWTLVTSPNPGSYASVLEGVSCVSVGDCWAVGYSTSNGNATIQTLVEHWTGTTWTVVPSPSSAKAQTILGGVTCVNAHECWAVGYDYTNTIIEAYNGSIWSIVSSPEAGPTQNNLNGVACASANDCWAVGFFISGSSWLTLAEHYDGTAWSIVNSPNPSATQSDLLGVACASVNDCWAVGDSFSSGVGFQSLIEQYTSSGWSIASSPNPSTTENILSGVTCINASDCLAVGQYIYGPGYGVVGTLVEENTGSGWSVVTTPNSGSSNNGLYGVSCMFECQAVGNYYDGTTTHTLVETNMPTTIFDDGNSNVTYDSWVGVLDPTANGGTYRVSPTKGATVTFKFAGTRITWVTRKGPFQGIATVTIDGKWKGTIDLYATTSQSFSQRYAGLTSKHHTIVIKVSGNKNPASGNTNVAVDAFIVGSTTTQETAPNVTYDNWTGAMSASASGGTYRTDGKANAHSSLTFTGTGVAWVTAFGPSGGKASVTIDGVLVAMIDSYAPTVQWQVTESFAGLATGSHKILVTVLGTKNTASMGTQVVVDAFVVAS